MNAARNARLLVAATAASRIGDVISAVALVVVVADHTHSATWLAAAGVVRLVPYVALGTITGRLAARWDRRAMAVGADVASAVLLTATTVLVLTDASLTLILAVATLASVAGAFHGPAFMALVPVAVDGDRLGSVNASFGVVENVVGLAGPLIAGVAIVSGVPGMAFAINAASFMASAALLGALSCTSAARCDQNGETRCPWTPQTRFVVSALAVASLVYGFETVLLALYAQRRLGSSSVLVLLEGAVAIGGLVAALPAARIARRTQSTAVLVPGVALLGLPLMGLAVVSTPAAACALLLIEGGANVVVDVVAITLIQRHTPAPALPGVTGVLHSVVTGAILLGMTAAPLTIGGCFR